MHLIVIALCAGFILWELAYPAWMLFEKADSYFEAADRWNAYAMRGDFAEHGYTEEFVVMRRDVCMEKGNAYARAAMRRWWKQTKRPEVAL